MKLYCLKDKLVNEFNAPFISKSDEVAMRMFKEMLEGKAKRGELASADADLELFSVGKFDPSGVSNVIINGESVKMLVSGAAIIAGFKKEN